MRFWVHLSFGSPSPALDRRILSGLLFYPYLDESIFHKEGEFIQIGQSRKYARHTIAEMAERAGFTTEYVVSSPQDVNIHRLRVAKGLDL